MFVTQVIVTTHFYMLSINLLFLPERDPFRSLWKAVFEVVCGTSSGKEAFPDSVKELVSYLRLAVCDSVILNLQWSTAMNDSGIALRAIFGDLVVPRAFSVDVLTICVDYNSAIYALRKFHQTIKMACAVKMVLPAIRPAFHAVFHRRRSAVLVKRLENP